MTSGIIDILINDATVTDLVGTNVAGNKYKVFPVRAPQGEQLPYIIVSLNSNDAITSAAKDEVSLLDYTRYVVLCYAKNYRDAEILREAVRQVLDLKAWNTDYVIFLKIWLTNEQDLFDEQAQAYVCTSTYGAEIKRFEPT